MNISAKFQLYPRYSFRRVDSLHPHPHPTPAKFNLSVAMAATNWEVWTKMIRLMEDH